MPEMASIAPTAGGQYHWTSEFAPRQYQKILSFSVDFFCVLGWQTSLAAACFVSMLYLYKQGDQDEFPRHLHNK